MPQPRTLPAADTSRKRHGSAPNRTTRSSARSPEPGRSRSRSLAGKITLHVALLVLLVLSLMALASTATLHAILERQLSNQLRSAAQRAQNVVDSRAAPVVSEAQFQATVPSGSFAIGLDADGSAVVTARAQGLDQKALLDPVRRAAPGQMVTVAQVNDPIRAVLIPLDPRAPLVVSVAGRPLRVIALVIGFDTTDAERTVRDTAVLEAILAVLAGVVIVVLLPVVLKRTLRPIHDMTHAARAVAAGEVDRRLPVDVGVTEGDVLAGAVNDALDARQDAEMRVRQFVADASHELRTPLTTIEGWAELYRQGGLADPELLDRALDRIADSASHLTALVEDLSLLARLDVGRPLLEERVDLAVIATAAVEDTRVIDPTRPVTLVLPSPGSAVVTGDEQRLRQVLINLTGNALQHTSSGTPVSVIVERRADRVLVIVADRGLGIPTEHQPKIFDRFYRVGGSRTTGGTGLGLAIVRSLVEAHDGSVSVRSDRTGTTFTVELPVHS